MDNAPTMRLRATEKNRASNGVTIAVRPQSRGGFTIHVVDIMGKVLVKPQYVKTSAEVSPMIRDELRMLDKCGWDVPMADASRHRPR